MTVRQAIAVAIAATILCGGNLSAAQGVKGPQTSEAEYSLKPSDVVLPSGVPLGQYRRIFQPFENWTLVCDENLKTNQRVCNVSQSVVDKSGSNIFSWSLAAEKNGRPFMILRTLPEAKIDNVIELRFPGVKSPVRVPFDACNTAVCIGRTPVGSVLSSQINKGSIVSVTYRTTTGRTISVSVPLKGLKEAVASIN